MKTSVFAIGDLHLAGAVDKPMDIFGKQWEGHWERIKKDWEERVSSDDIVLIPGDISWAMKLSDAKIDLDNIAKLPGKKILVKGNHDYWWSSVSKVRSVLPSSMRVLQNDSVTVSGFAFCGTRGWINPEMKDFTQQDAKVYNREVQRLKLSLDSVALLQQTEKDMEESNALIVMIHYPPFDDKGQPTEIVNMLTQYRPDHVVYGHLHGEGSRIAFEGEYEGVEYHLVSCDYLNFQLKQIV
ncbi:MAG: hypothetical protein GX815_07875 [Clostridiales bacterium]|nr:hypothetical protein [Clostridiales bacterium]